jgi:hypothetical protein
MPSICLAVIIFTVDGKDPEQNDYIQIFILWLTSLLKSKSLTKNDLLFLTVDAETLDYLEKATPMIQILNKLESALHIQKRTKPKSVLEGTLWRYIYTEHRGDIYIYCDIDILICKPIHKLISQLESNTVYVLEEGNLSAEVYSLGILDEEFELIRSISSNLPGLNSGLFILTNYLQKKTIFNKIENYVPSTQRFIYTLDQPLFNRAVYTSITEKKINLNTILLRRNTVHYNNGFMLENKEIPIFYDCNGDVGVGYRHLHRIINTFCFLNYNEY